MHEYVTTFTNRAWWIARLALLAAAISVGLRGLIALLDADPPSWATPPGALVIFAALFWLFDRFLWRVKIFGWQPFSSIPTLNGYWSGQIDIRTPNDADNVEPLKCVVKIEQTWARISIEFETEFTTSISIIARLGPKAEPNGGLRYEYDVSPKAGVERHDDMHRHFGLARLQPQAEEWTTLTGEFYNDRAYQRWGTYTLNYHKHRPPQHWDPPADKDEDNKTKEVKADEAKPNGAKAVTQRDTAASDTKATVETRTAEGGARPGEDASASR